MTTPLLQRAAATTRLRQPVFCCFHLHPSPCIPPKSEGILPSTLDASSARSSCLQSASCRVPRMQPHPPTEHRPSPSKRRRILTGHRQYAIPSPSSFQLHRISLALRFPPRSNSNRYWMSFTSLQARNSSFIQPPVFKADSSTPPTLGLSTSMKRCTSDTFPAEELRSLRLIPNSAQFSTFPIPSLPAPLLCVHSAA